MRGSRSDRAVAPVIGHILLVAVVVIIATTVAVFGFGFVDDMPQPAPNVADSSGEFVPQDGNDGGIVRIEHLGGDEVPVKEMEIVVKAECGSETKQGRIVNLPAGDGNNIDDDQIEGDNIIDQSYLKTIDNSVEGVDGGGALLHNKQYSVGESIIFRIPDSKCSLTSGASVTVDVVHTPSQSVIISEELTA
jgi:flagellin-like protein